MSKNKNHNLLKKIMVAFIIVCTIYLIISIRYLCPYFKNFLYNYYIIEPNDLPNYSDLFNSIFVILNIVMTSIFSYIIYNIYVLQYNTSYNSDIAGPVAMLYYVLKFNIISSIHILLLNNIDQLEPSKYLKEYNGVKTELEAIDFIKINFIGINRIPELDEYLKSTIANINDEYMRMKLFAICEDIRLYYINKKINGTTSKDNKMDDRLGYVLSKELFENGELKEKNSLKWCKVLSNMYENNWNDMNEVYKNLMENLMQISETKK